MEKSVDACAGMWDDRPTLSKYQPQPPRAGQETEMNKTVDEWVSQNTNGARIVGADNFPAAHDELQAYANELAEKASLKGLPFGVVDIRLCLDREAEITSALLRELEERD